MLTANARDKHTLGTWFRQPSSWLSLVATVISVTTFFLVYAHKGEVRVVVPDELGVALLDGDLSVLLPLTLTNTGAPRTTTHIARIMATVKETAPTGTSAATVEVRWRRELMYTKIENTPYLEDELKYLNRAVPFALNGEQSTQKVYELIQVDTGFKPSIGNISLTVRVTTAESGLFVSETAYYDCRSEDKDREFKKLELASRHRYCRRLWRDTTKGDA